MTTPMLSVLAEGSAPAATPFDDIEAVVAAYEQRIFRFLLSSLRDRDAAQSLTQDTFLKAWAARASFRGDCAVFTWLMRIAVNLLRDHTRTNRFRFWRKAAEKSVDAAELAQYLPEPVSTVEARMVAQEQMGRVWDSVATLSPRQRSVFLLRFVEEMNLAEIAEATELPISTVKSHLYRALAIVREKQEQGGVRKEAEGRAPRREAKR